MKAVILQSNYIPWKGYFDLINDCDVFIFYDIVKYTKNDWRNRNTIYTKNGKQWLSIPIAADAVNLKIEEVQLTQNWQESHFKSLYLGYKKAPYFNQLEILINDFLVEKKWETLSELNQYLIKKIAGRLGCQTRFVNANEHNPSGTKVEKLIDLLQKVNADEYISGMAAKEYIDKEMHLFDGHNIKLTFKTYPLYPVYKQLKEPFENSVSIVDLIANIHWDEIPNYIWANEK